MIVSAEHRLLASLRERSKVQGWLRDFAQRAALPEAVTHSLDLALEEWLTNIISYAHDDGDEHWIDLRFVSTPDEVRVEIEDDGRPFDPLTHPRVDTTAPLESRSVGGLGIHMIRQLMETVSYRREKDRNILTLTKRIPRSA